MFKSTDRYFRIIVNITDIIKNPKDIRDIMDSHPSTGRTLLGGGYSDL